MEHFSQRNQPGPKAKRAVHPDESGQATRVWLVLSKAQRAIGQNAAASVAALGLCLSDFAVLEVLLHKGPQPVNVIGRKVLLTSGSITTAVDRLESRQLVRRTLDPSDRRARIVALTAAGRRLIASAFRRHAADMEQTLAVLSPGERRDLVRLLKKAGLWAAARLERSSTTSAAGTPQPAR